jgi:peptidoglycan hydrolase-like protein with peptidoglycan-binding domain/pimeloyl-ACP methyl ester carboxylesterase
MSINEFNPGNSLKTGVDSFTGLPGRISDINRELFGQPLSKAPNSILGGIPMNPLLEADDRSISATQTKTRSGASSVYEDESGTFPIDRAAQQVGKALMDNTITAPVPSGDRVDRTERYDELLNPNPSNLSATVSWRDRAYNETYSENFLPSGQLSGSDRLNHPFVGVIDTGFNGQNHGTQVINVIQRVGHQFPDWLADSVGSGTWSESLVNFVDAAKASKRSSAVINLSFDLTQINLDGSISTRFELTTAEKEALKYAQANGVLVVVSAGNQGGAMSALGQASQEFDNVIAVGATEGGQRSDYSSYGEGLDFVASGDGKGEAMGTSLAAARVTGSIAQIWDANPKLDYRQVIKTLESTAIDLQKPGWDRETGYGQLNTSAAIDLAEDLAFQPQSLSNSQLQNTIKSDRADQDLHNAIVERESLVWQKSNGAIPSERPNRVLEGDGIQPEPTPNVTSSSSRETSSLDSPLKYEPGARLQYDEQVKQWQQRMQERGWNITDDGFYGSQSAQIARQFQQEKGLGVDGIVGPDTWAATFDTTNVGATNNVTNSPSSGSPSLDSLLKYEPGVRLKYDEQVKQWQQRMSDRGWNIDVDGLYGPQSAQIARKFQQEKGLAVDGIVGPDTWAATFDTNNATGSIPAAPNTSTPLSDPAQKLLNVARSYIGVREQGGNNRGRQVEEFQRAIGGAAAEPWCMSFAQYCIKAAESATQANSQVTQSEHCLTVWNGSPSQLRSSRPEPGSLVIWRDITSIKGEGHVGIVEAVNSDGTFTTIEGNTSDSSGINREGEGVYRKQRDMDGAGDLRVVGFLKVFPDYTPADVSDPSSPPKSPTTPTAPPATKGKQSPISGDIDTRAGFGELNIWRYDTKGRSNQGIIERGKETVLIIHGWQRSDQSPNIEKLAKEASESDDVQVLALDWSDIAQAGLDFLPFTPPYNTAEWIAPVAKWAYNELENSGIAPNQLTLVGHSLGSYVSSEIARQFGQVKNLVALDPAYPATTSLLGGYDIDPITDGTQSPADFSKVAANSLAFVVENNSLAFVVEDVVDASGGIAGDSDKAATAEDSFVIRYSSYDLDFVTPHENVVNVFTEALDKKHLKLPNLTLPNHEDNWYSDNGNKLNSFTSDLPDWLKGALDLNHHEGRISATSTGEIEGLTLVVDSSGTERTIWT